MKAVYGWGGPVTLYPANKTSFVLFLTGDRIEGRYSYPSFHSRKGGRKVAKLASCCSSRVAAKRIPIRPSIHQDSVLGPRVSSVENKQILHFCLNASHKGASIYDIRTEGGGGLINATSLQTNCSTDFADREGRGSKNPKILRT